ncbi:MAG: hypothetical protein ABIN89_05030 [Chitinophagaceae bacterium]
MEPSRKKASPENEKPETPVELARTEAEEDIADDPDFQDDPKSDDLDEGELANLDNSNDNEI